MAELILSQEAQDKLGGVIKDIDGLMYQIDSANEAIKEACKAVAEDIDIRAADVKKIASLFHKNNVTEERERAEMIFELAEKMLSKY